jgi:hypothetical protein
LENFGIFIINCRVVGWWENKKHDLEGLWWLEVHKVIHVPEAI